MILLMHLDLSGPAERTRSPLYIGQFGRANCRPWQALFAAGIAGGCWSAAKRRKRRKRANDLDGRPALMNVRAGPASGVAHNLSSQFGVQTSSRCDAAHLTTTSPAIRLGQIQDDPGKNYDCRRRMRSPAAGNCPSGPELDAAE